MEKKNNEQETGILSANFLLPQHNIIILGIYLRHTLKIFF